MGAQIVVWSVVDPHTWSSILQQAVEAKELGIIPFELRLDYDYWTYRTYVGDRILSKPIRWKPAVEIMKAILPEESQEEIPVGFSIVGHVGK